MNERSWLFGRLYLKKTNFKTFNKKYMLFENFGIIHTSLNYKKNNLWFYHQKEMWLITLMNSL